jgi:hypothetical protein
VRENAPNPKASGRPPVDPMIAANQDAVGEFGSGGPDEA